jgi:hypothetical protein
MEGYKQPSIEDMQDVGELMYGRRTYTADDINQMSISEYAAIRPKLFFDPAQENNYGYYRNLWVETGEIEYLEKMMGCVTDDEW